MTHLDDEVKTGDPGLPELSGTEVIARFHWMIDQQDSPVIPSRGTRAIATLSQPFKAPEVLGLMAQRSTQSRKPT